MTYDIAILRGDGIGPEIVDQATKVLAATAESVRGVDLKLDYLDGGADYYVRTGQVAPEETWAAMRRADAILMGSMGHPDIRMPDGTEVQGHFIVNARKSLDLYAGVRPIKAYPGSRGLDPEAEVDLVIVRESTEGLFASFGGGAQVSDDVFADTMIVTRKGTERISRYALNLAAERNGRPSDGQKLVTCVDKANIFRSLAFFRRVFDEVAAEHPGVQTDHALVDSFSMNMMLQPEQYDVLVTENMFGDILSDLAAALVGGLGLAPSGDIGDDHAMFQPAHGSAPDIAGQDRANPVATIVSARMMLDWLAQRHDDDNLRAGAKIIEQSVVETMASGQLTADLGGSLSCSEFGDAVAEAVARVAQEHAA
ncbi:isocitrate/isopropylmalate dehydrogenase family protein [Mycobacterium sp. 21AC1]|uniref:isocitrate/isopropylmalate dehydrogenase family protein n=1 Tax=[Mycobacterium] appelbergii TaxID=2939269 RepID=UPI002938E054|nr:isocitrate/isopropylmalate dehydrogenase family protein [Mycobacterium sp. 21AC1]MDV3130198.1 isocitrate/isopropylmalate dehydrogenase family protein [Mycobacterium sp. 21AC1]